MSACLLQSAPSFSQAAEPAISAGVASVNLNPKRVTFDRLGKSATISVASSSGTGSFDVELIDRVMLPDGQIVPASDAAGKPEFERLKSARAYLVATPRRIRVAQGTGQTIRIRAASTSEVPPGEYRTHLTVTGIPPADSGLTAEEAAGRKEGELSFRINSVLALSIPVIVRVGPVDIRAAIEKAAISFENVSPDGQAPAVRTAILTLDLVRQGANSLYGDIEIKGSKKQGEEPIGAVRGIGVYPEIERRYVRVQLTRLPAPGERIDIEFRDDDTSPGKVLSKASVAAP
ncbi:fimbrial biogenesis chaperone [Rhizorhabdus sp. FW153]|uniref:hypothetical protein n=1 Tax=Rhizorhabdus sp. FW153 TaxID=3400216 RepID=UPI003CF6DA07